MPEMQGQVERVAAQSRCETPSSGSPAATEIESLGSFPFDSMLCASDLQLGAREQKLLSLGGEKKETLDQLLAREATIRARMESRDPDETKLPAAQLEAKAREEYASL